MPAGLDGNPNPLATPAREVVLTHVVEALVGDPGQRLAIAVDGASGTGKSTFADELAVRIEAAGRGVLRATIDSFHRPRAERYARGKDSAEGYYRDSHDLGAVVRQVLAPFTAGATVIDRAAFDEPSDTPTSEVVSGLGSDCVLLFDGLFLHRSELRPHWHRSLFLVADRRRRAAWDAHWTGRDPAEAERRRHRYFEGQALYEAECEPHSRATWVIDNDDLAAPCLMPAR